jgi:hypothetical protein
LFSWWLLLSTLKYNGTFIVFGSFLIFLFIFGIIKRKKYNL